MKKDEVKPNIALVGEKGLRVINTASQTIRLPEDQSKPFFHKDARLIIQTFSDFYKPVTSKDGK